MPRVNLPLSTEFALLGFLRRRPMYGYEIHQQLSHATGLGLVWRLKQSQLYALLTKLENEGFVTTTVELQDTRPPRKMFELTETGRQKFLNWIEQPVGRLGVCAPDFMTSSTCPGRRGQIVVQRLVRRLGNSPAQARWQ
ncbi:MAG: PadR family transcriptional regulator [Anaerolineae bacterium]